MTTTTTTTTTMKTIKYIITDGNAREEAATLEQAAEIAASWFEFLGDDPRFVGFTPPKAALDCRSIDSLNASIEAWLAEIASHLGAKDWYGHGAYHVTAADHAGLRLCVEPAD